MNRGPLASTFLLLAAFAGAQAPLPLPALDAATLVYDTKAGAPLAWSNLLDELARLDVVFLGETHVDDTTHRVELHVLEQLLARRRGKVVLSLEMFERDVQPALDDYLQGRIDEPAFLAQARPWENYHTAYRPLIEAAKAARIPVVAANFPGSLRRVLRGGGKAAIDALSPEQRALMPAEFFPASAAYWERVDRAVRGHMGGPGGGTPEERLYETQNLWDNAMGDNIAKARVAHQDAVVLHVAGGFHVAFRDGTVAQFARRSAASRFAVVQIAPTAALHLARPDRDRPQADYLVYAETLARDLHEGTYAVEVPAELRYRLAVPAHGAGLPLLVWLPDRATRSEDAFAFWRLALGEAAAVAVVEPPFPELQDDLATGGRYVSGDAFRHDYTRTQHALARLVEHVTRRFPVDARAVLVAGVGDGGAAVLWTALYGEWLEVDFAALDPTDLTRLAMEALPDQRPVARSLQILARDGDQARLAAIAADYEKVGTAAKVVPLAAGSEALTAFVSGQLGLPARPGPAVDGATLLVPDNGLPRTREWAELYATRLQQQGVATRLVASPPPDAAPTSVRRLTVGGDGQWPAAWFANGDGLPLAGGPFGGTTVIVLPAGTSATDRATWLEHEKNRVIKKRNPFANLAIACADGEPSLRTVIETLRTRGRSRFLIVPAAFCVDGPTMRALRTQLGDAAQGLDLAWLPGLGAALAAAAR